MYEIQGWYSEIYGWETVTAADSKTEAYDLLSDYRENEPTIAFRVTRHG